MSQYDQDDKAQVHMASNDVGLTAAQIEAMEGVDPALLAEGVELIREEKAMGFREAWRHQKKAVIWSMVMSIALIMDGYDGSTTTAFYGLPAFKNSFGSSFHNPKTGKDEMIIPANWQALISLITLPGNLLALAIVGWATDRFGFKRVYSAGMILIILIIFMFVFLKNLRMLVAAQALIGFCWGVFQTITAGYAVEICPIRLRGLAASFISMAWGSGALISAGVNRGTLTIKSDWGWRLPYALQWVWPVPLFLASLFAPESPYWLVRNGKFEEAKKGLKSVASRGYYDSRNIDGYIEFIKHTDQLEKVQASKGSYAEMFKGTNLRRTEIMLCIWGCQQCAGLNLTSWAITFLQSAGMSVEFSFSMNIIIQSMNIIGCALEFFVINRVGRRPLMLTGMLTLAVCLLIIGVLGFVHETAPVQRAIASFMVLINLFFHFTIGPVSYTMAAEIPATRLRARSIAMGRCFYVAGGAIVNQLTPRMLGPDKWAWGPRAGLFWMGVNLIFTTWFFFRVPETAGFSFAELEILFSNKVSARKFTKTRVHDEAAGGQTFDVGVDSNLPEVEKGGVVRVESVVRG